MPIVATSYKTVPKRLYHFTSGAAAYSIISLNAGKDKEICFWLKNAKNKNDAAELKLGTALVDGLQQYMQRNNRRSVLNEININPDLVYVNSFTEMDISEHLLNEYGNFRLEFDFGSFSGRSEIRECAYFQEEDINTLVDHYCSLLDRDWKLMSGEKKDINAQRGYLMQGLSAMISIPLLKHLDEWGEEAEWRHVLYQQSIDDRMFSMSDGSLRMKSYYPASTLKSITCYTTQKNKNKDLPFYYKIKHRVKLNGWKTQVGIEMDKDLDLK